MMTTFRSCHVIINRKLADDCRYARDFADFFRLGSIYTLFCRWIPSTNANIFSFYNAHFGKTLNISTANDSTFIVHRNKTQER